MDAEPSVEASDGINDDTVLGGFTVIGRKIRYGRNVPREVLPSWITNATMFSHDVNIRQSIQDITDLTHDMRSRLIELGYTELFPVQSSVIPLILRSYRMTKRRPLCRPSDLCISAPTGSGKTLAYAVPIVQLLALRTQTFVRALVILPVRDLAAQVFNVFKDLTSGTDLKVALLCGQKSFLKEQMDLVDNTSNTPQCKVDIVIATPGRLVDHLYNTVGFNVERLRILVIDEADRVIVEEKQDWYRLLEDALYHFNVLAFDSDTQPEPTRPAERIRSKPVLSIMNQYDTSHDLTLQKILVSATLTHDPGPLKRFNLYFPHLVTSSPKGQAISAPIPVNGLDQKQNSGQTTLKDSNDSSVCGMNDQQVIDAEVKAVGGVGIFSTPCGLREHVVCVTQEQRALFLLHLVRHKHIKRILCFTNARIITKRLSLLLQNVSGIKASPISSEMPPNKRQHVLQAFSRGDLDILVCTDSMARGMDIKGVQCVVSYEIPLNVKTYVHRIGRTARAGQTGLAFTLLLKNQFFHFKKELRSVGKTKLKEVRFHGSHMADLRAEYAKALKLLEASVKKDSQSATDRSTKLFGATSKQLDSNKNSTDGQDPSGEARRRKRKTRLRTMDEKQ
ncbi:putative dead box ATP-dependent RNA helicase [Paragonimus heterotremus]|uniref:ATP-dependent RNA helicase n=1 Tax=Paragonimus heterotremus TaxID=100268 RepID=A0A8J4WEY3_9TREM|nr:putative dead box ATP-dependent RNA helicase [Paragonimus heterotremus]